MQNGIKKMIDKPRKGEFPAYFGTYIEKVENEDIISFLKIQKDEFVSFLVNEIKGKRNHRYEEGKWTCQELLGHIIDTERVMMYRAFFIARNDQQNLPGFEQDDYVNAGGFGNRDFDEMIEEFVLARDNTLQLLKTITEEDFQKKGSINGFQTSLTAMPFIMAGHVLHHQEILKQKYLK